MCSLHEKSLKLGKVRKIFAVLIAAFPSASRSPRLLTLAPLPCAARSLRYRPEASPVLFPSLSSPLSSPSPPSRSAALALAPSAVPGLRNLLFQNPFRRVKTSREGGNVAGGWKCCGRVEVSALCLELLVRACRIALPGRNRPPGTGIPSRAEKSGESTLPRSG